ncbi:hypothetical protein [Xanthomonas euvesicatoria]|uniref:hypothetical protein n=1 Tax=Xanthomonas euvesicatoria TaxID=456327 RepID=UPI000699DE28|nr:hypothetical protein XaclCFBP3371_00690 [Xanthomonas euvesicatoria pv. citrumelonis]
MSLKLGRATTGQRVGDTLDMLERARHTGFGMRHRRPAVIHRRIALQTMKLHGMGLPISDFVAKEVLDAWTDVVRPQPQWSVGVQVASNEAHTDGIAQRFHTPGDALQSIRIAR